MRRPTRCLCAALVCSATALASPPAVAEQGRIDRTAEVVARALAEAVVARDADAAAALCAVPANLDGERATSEEAVRAAWQRALDRRSLRGVRIVSVEVITLDAAIRQFGEPPSRLGDLPDGETLVAILRLDRTQLVAVLARHDDRWAVVAVTD